jgi:hypothetical protein
MGNVTYTSIYNRVKALAGIPSPDANAQTQITEYINRRARMAFEASDFWPRWLVFGELRNYQSTTVSAGNFVIGYTYTILTIGSTPTNWTSIGASSATVGTVFVATGVGTGNGTATWNSNIIPFTEAGKDTIDKFIRVHKVYQPFYLNSALELEFYVTNSGASVVGDTNSSTASAYVTYKKDWDGPYTNVSTNIPEEWQEYISHGAYADWVRADGKNDVALAEEAFAQNILDGELGSVDVTRSVGIAAQRISTHVSRSFRS